MKRIALILTCVFLGAVSCTEKKVDIQEEEKTAYDNLSGGIINVTKSWAYEVPAYYYGTFYAFNGWFFENTPSNNFNTGHSSDIGALTLNNLETQKQTFLPEGFIYTNKGNVTALPLQFALKSENGNTTSLFSVDGSYFPDFANPGELPNEISRSNEFKFILHNMTGTSSITVSFMGSGVQKTFTDSIIHFQPEELALLSSTSYAVLEIFLNSKQTVLHKEDGKEYQCTYSSRFTKRGISIK